MSSKRTIHSLPIETLGLIFTFLVPDFDGWVASQTEVYNWSYIIRVTAVCRRWSHAALTFPRLWSYVAPHRITPALFTELLRRSGDASLDVNIDMLNITHTILKILNDECRRLRRISILAISFEDIQSSFPAALQTLEMTLQNDAPRLEELSIHEHQACDILARMSLTNSLQFPRGLFSSNFPVLHSLQLETICSLPPIFENLTELTLARCNLDMRRHDNLQALLATLRANPRLMHLDLDEALIGDHHNAVQGPQTEDDIISLPLLKLLVLRDFPFATRRFLAFLNLSPATKIWLTSTTFVHMVENNNTFLLEALPPNMSNLRPFNDISTVQVRQSMPVRYMAWNQDHTIRLYIDIKAISGFAQISCSYAFEASLRNLRPLCSSSVTTLVIEPAPVLHFDNPWPSIFDSLPNLHTLGVEGTLIAETFLALVVQKSGRCPSLKSLRMACTSITLEVRQALYAMISNRHKASRRPVKNEQKITRIEEVRFVLVPQKEGEKEEKAALSLLLAKSSLSSLVPDITIVPERPPKETTKAWWQDGYGIDL